MNKSFKGFPICVLALILICTMHTAGAMTVSVNDTSSNYDTTIDIPINVSDAPWQVGAMDISLTYNSSVLTALGVVNESLTAGVLVMNDSTITKPNPEPGNWTGAYISDADNETVRNYGALANNTTATDGVVNISIISRYGFNGTGSIAVIKFKVIGSHGDTSLLTLSTVAAYNLSAPYNKSGYIPDTVNITNGYDPIYNTTEDGTFTVTDGGLEKTGNIDGIGDVDFDDAIYLARYTIFGEDNYPLHADGDVDSSGDVDFDDAIYLARYTIFGEDNYPLYPGPE